MSPFYTDYQKFWDCLLDSGDPVHLIWKVNNCILAAILWVLDHLRDLSATLCQTKPKKQRVIGTHTIFYSHHNIPKEAYPCIASSPSVYESLLANKRQKRWWGVTLWPPSYFRRVFHTEGGGLWRWPWRTRLPYCGKVCETDTWHGVCVTSRDWKHP